jgi:hypothetical protein
MITEASTSIKRLFSGPVYVSGSSLRGAQATKRSIFALRHGLLRWRSQSRPRRYRFANPPEVALTITVFIRYQLDPFKRAMFEQYSRRWLAIIPRCGGDLVGYWMPHEGTNNIAFALISFENLAAYESYRARLRGDADGIANFSFAEENKFILAEERTFLRKVAG